MSVISKLVPRLLVCATIALAMTPWTSQAASTGIRMCNPGFPPCPDDMFCDDKTYLCSSCDADVCNKEADDWKDACQRNCPKHFAKLLLQTTSPPAVATVPEPDVAANQLKDSMGQAIPSEAKASETQRTDSWTSNKTLVAAIGVVVASVVVTAIAVAIVGFLCYRSRQQTQNRPLEVTAEENLRPGRSRRNLPVTSDVDERRALEAGASVGNDKPECADTNQRSETEERLLETDF